MIWDPLRMKSQPKGWLFFPIPSGADNLTLDACNFSQIGGVVEI